MKKTAMSDDCFVELFDAPLHLDNPSGSSLSGITIAVKDNIDVAGYITGAGSPTWRSRHGPAESHAPIIQDLLDAGSILTGKTHLDELAYSLMGANAHYGTPLNPQAPTRVPGGSSSGSASATAQNLCMIGIGSDTGGSVRIPASFCGLFGLRPTHGLLSNQGLVPLAPSFDTVGFFAADLSLMQKVAEVVGLLNGEEKATPHLSFPDPFWNLVLPDVFEDLVVVRRSMASYGNSTTLFDGVDFDQLFDTFRTIQAFEAWQALGPWIQEHRPNFGPGIHERFQMAAQVQEHAFAQACSIRQDWTDDLLDRWPDNMLICIPTAPGPAPLKQCSEAKLDAFRNRALRMLCPAGLAKLPQLTLPLTSVQGAPFGISIMGKPGSEPQLFQAGFALINEKVGSS